ncbi:unnamed protein product [Didymodactylos carnosus]|uniref:Uncharacterized protein n=1 Tax=Didymodactylos carnosus TaxID=1234261 RepID=A0A814TLL3_9BILA|nr:unnamed protein product [Didymodactylos carnosus]CAF1164006.1 unnamed protein product [Didymodactylos carnosus]CAF3506975.1 unnamed protein product [Didymodactylos carnosus]CAF3927600.1 unnamed protein product [Didymodactylos carnosus]
MGSHEFKLLGTHVEPSEKLPINIKVALAKILDESRNNNSTTIESLISKLQKHSHIIQLWDELNRFLFSMEIYKSEFDRSYFNTSFDGESWSFRRTCKNIKGVMAKL